MLGVGGFGMGLRLRDNGLELHIMARKQAQRVQGGLAAVLGLVVTLSAIPCDLLVTFSQTGLPL